MMRSRALGRRTAVVRLAVAVLSLSFAACLPAPPADKRGTTSITLYGFSIMKASLEKEIIPAFKAKWKREHGEDIDFAYSFAGSETVTNTILQGAPADVAILAIER